MTHPILVAVTPRRPAGAVWTPSYRPSSRARSLLYIGGAIVLVAAIVTVIALSHSNAHRWPKSVVIGSRL